MEVIFQKINSVFIQSNLIDRANSLDMHVSEFSFYAGFPDSMSMELHSRSSIRDSTFFFRILREGVTENLDPSTSSQAEQSAQSNQSSKPEQKKSPRQHYHNQDQEYIYGWLSFHDLYFYTFRLGLILKWSS